MVHSNFQMTYKLSFWHNYIDVYILFAGIPVPFEISPLLGGLIGVVTALLFITIAIPIAMKIRNERRTQRPSDLPLKKSTAPSSEDLYDTEDRNPDVVPINKGIYTRIYIILCETYQLMGDRMWYAHLCYCKYFFFFFFFFFFFIYQGSIRTVDQCQSPATPLDSLEYMSICNIWPQAFGRGNQWVPSERGNTSDANAAHWSAISRD